MPSLSPKPSVPQPRLRILHLTDTHLFGDGSKHYGIVDTADHLRRALAHMDGQGFDLVVCSGDVSEDGTEASYELARQILVPWAEARGARTIFAMGNHDQRAEFRAVLGHGQLGLEQAGVEVRELLDEKDAGGSARLTEPGDPPPIASSVTIDGWRTLVLDTSVPRAGYGALGAEQLEFLRSELATPAEHGTVIVMHHAPVDAQTDLLQALALDESDADELWEALRGSDVRVILSGHYHLPIVETVDGIPVVVAPGVANIARSFGPRAEESAVDSFGGAVIEISPRRVRVVPFEVPVTGEEVFRLSEKVVGQIIAAAGRPQG